MADEDHTQIANSSDIRSVDGGDIGAKPMFRDQVKVGKAVVMAHERGAMLRTVVAGGGSIGPGVVKPVTGYRSEGRTLKIYDDLRSRSARSGAVEYWIANDGLYHVSGVPLTNSAATEALIEVRGGQVALLADERDTSTYDAVLRAHFPAEAAAADAELDLKRRVEDERATIGSETIDGFTVIPEWAESPLRNLPPRADGMTEDEYIAHAARPSHYVVQSPVFAKATTAEKCAEQARARYDEMQKRERRREEERENAQKEAEQNGLPNLKGSDRQVRWAMNIRRRYIESNGVDRVARERKTARWWIDNYKNLTRD